QGGGGALEDVGASVSVEIDIPCGDGGPGEGLADAVEDDLIRRSGLGDRGHVVAGGALDDQAAEAADEGGPQGAVLERFHLGPGLERPPCRLGNGPGLGSEPTTQEIESEHDETPSELAGLVMEKNRGRAAWESRTVAANVRFDRSPLYQRVS